MDDPAEALKGLRDSLRSGISDVDEYTFQLSSTLDSIGLGPMSVPCSANDKAIQRYLPAVQQGLLNTIPTFLPALDDRGRKLLDSFFCPPTSAATAPTTRQVALAAYLTITAALAPAPPTPLPAEAREYVLETLANLSQAYSIDALYWATHGKRPSPLLWDDAVRTSTSLPAKAANAVGRWKEGAWSGDVPAALVPRAYFDNYVRRLEGLLYEVSQSSEDLGSLREVLEKLGRLGLFTIMPATEIDTPTPSFFPAFLPSALEHLHPPAGSPLPPYPHTFFPDLLLPLADANLRAFISGLLAHLALKISPPYAEPMTADKPEESVKRASVILGQFLGKPDTSSDAWGAVIEALLSKSVSLERTMDSIRRIATGWVGSGSASEARSYLDAVLEAWCDPKHIKYASYAAQYSKSIADGAITDTQDLTHLVILAVSLLPPMDSHLVTLSHRARFIQAIQAYLFHPEPKIRRLGMLIAEIMSERTIEEGDDASGPSEDEQMKDLQDKLMGEDDPSRAAPKAPGGPKRLKFGFKGAWDGDGDGKEECRMLRSSVGLRDDDASLSDGDWQLGWHRGQEEAPPPRRPDVEREHAPKAERKGRSREPKPKPKVVMLDPDQEADPLQGYESAGSESSRSRSPSPSYLAEVAADPTLALDAAKKKKLKRPVYVRQLADLLRDKDSPDSIELALTYGEPLVRAKRNFGGEVVENAVNVAGAAIALANPFHLPDFDARRQGLLTALVACSPTNVPPFLAQQYFSQSYSLLQKGVMLTALAMGARELAGLSAPEARTKAVDFPSKMLPAHLHNKYVTPADVPPGQGQGQLESAISGMRNLLLSKGAAAGEAHPEIARQKRLTVGQTKRRKVAEEGSLAARQMSGDGRAPQAPQTPVVPYAQVAGEYFVLPLVNRFWEYFQNASVRARSLGDRYRGAGTGMVLSPGALEKLLLTLALLTHAARHAPSFLSVLAPAVLELAVTVGARHRPAAQNLVGGGAGPSEPSAPGVPGAPGPGAPDEDGGDAQVVGSALELALAALDASVDLDAGRTLALDHPELVLAVGEWAHGTFEREQQGLKNAGQGGSREGRVRADAAGVVVKIAEIGEKWGAAPR